MSQQWWNAQQQSAMLGSHREVACCGDDKSNCRHRDVTALDDGAYLNGSTLWCKCCRSIGETTVTTTWRKI